MAQIGAIKQHRLPLMRGEIRPRGLEPGITPWINEVRKKIA